VESSLWAEAGAVIPLASPMSRMPVKANVDASMVNVRFKWALLSSDAVSSRFLRISSTKLDYLRKDVRVAGHSDMCAMEDVRTG
jgi:hypothetical protein